MAKRQQKKGNPEHGLQVAATQFMSWALDGEVQFFAISNNPRSAITGHLEKQRGMVAGVGDHCVFGRRGNGEMFVGFLEYKSEKGRQSPKQKEWEKICMETGAEYAVIRNLEQLKETLEDWNLL